MHKYLFFAAFFAFGNIYAQSNLNTAPKWLRNAAISPDGSQIAFSYQGDIFKISVNGGEALRLTIHEAYDADPVWSNDGKQLAFSSMRYGNKDVFVIPSTGGVAKRLTYHSADDIPTDFSPKGDKIIFTSSRLDDVASSIFPTAVLPELYEINILGGQEKRIISTPAETANFSDDGTWLFFHDKKGYEDPWRKHQNSAVTRDLFLYNTKENQYYPVTETATEERNPVFGNNGSYFFLSERSGTFNVWKASLVNNKESNAQQVTNFTKHPVRFLSRSANGTLCYTWDGEIYTQTEGGAPQKLAIVLQSDERYNEKVVESIRANATEFSVSPNGKEIAFVVHGEVFVASVEFGVTKRITDTADQERDIEFSPDGRKLLYAGERGGCWNIYETAIVNKEEEYFFDASQIKETTIVNSGKESFQAKYSPDGKEIAFLEERTTVRILNRASGNVRTVLAGKYNYSYSDGDQYYAWSPDSKWLLVPYMAYERWNTDIGLLNVNDGKMPINLSESGYNNQQPKFGMGGQMVYWSSDKEGYRSHGSWGSESDVFAIFLTEAAHKKFQLNKAEYALWKEQEDAKKDDKDKPDDKKNKQEKEKDKEEEKEESVKPFKIDFEGLLDRKEKLTIHSSRLSDFIVDKDAENIYYLTRFEEGTNLWRTKFREKETKMFVNLNSEDSKIAFDKKEENIFLIEKEGKIVKINVKEGKKEPVNFSSEMNLNQTAERSYMFEHSWRQFKKKFYLEDLHGVDWDFYKKEYAKFLPYINNSVDFADLLGEMLGEANASHTGARYRPMPNKANDATASLGIYIDNVYNGNGIRIAEVLDKSPLLKTKQKIRAGFIIEAIDDIKITPDQNYYELLNRKADKKVLVSIFDPKTGKRWNEVIEPITLAKENRLAYERWVKNREKDVDRMSNGRLGYVHVTGMDSESFREVFEKALGKYNDKEALIVDTRFNGGGWLHDDLATFLSGKSYINFEPRGQKNLGSEPQFKWQKPSTVIISEGNYSDAYMFPYTYKALGIGKLIGMPVPGTGTAVWWEKMIDGKTIFGIPQVGMRTIKEGRLMENFQLEPDIKVKNEPAKTNQGHDEQLQRAVDELLKK